jgi:hypothetical protein
VKPHAYATEVMRIVSKHAPVGMWSDTGDDRAGDAGAGGPAGTAACVVEMSVEEALPDAIEAARERGKLAWRE